MGNYVFYKLLIHNKYAKCVCWRFLGVFPFCKQKSQNCLRKVPSFYYMFFVPKPKNMINEQRNYTVFMHLTPELKAYIGITKQENWNKPSLYRSCVAYYYLLKSKQMILDATTFFNSGIPTSNDISEQEVSFGIRTIELYIVKPRLGGELYADIVANPANYTNEIEGTSTMAGLETAIEHLTYAYLLWDRSRLTRYTSVIKNDEHSTEPSSKDLWQICNAHYEIGIAFLEEVCEELQAPAPKQIPNGLIFGELMFK